jgi:outer membrane receptor protein involved in Fe transport
MRRILYLLLLAFCFIQASAQFGNRGAGSGEAQAGRFYGKVVDAKTNKPIEAASIQLVTNRRNTAVVSSRDSIINGQLTQGNGDFSLENVALFNNYRLVITALGYKAVEMPVSFLTADQQQKLMQAMGNRQPGAGNAPMATNPNTAASTPPQAGTTVAGTAADTSLAKSPVSDTATSKPTSAQLPTQTLTTIVDSAQMAAHPKPTPPVPTSTDTTARVATGMSDSTMRPAATPPTNQPPAGGRNGGNMAGMLRQALGNDFSSIMSQTDKDLGNIRLEPDAAALGNVTVTANQPVYTLGIDRKVFNVDRALTSQGQTAVEVLRQVPAVNVDIDGNVSLRNSSPTLFVDGRPTTLTLDQIPADAIQSIEVITNPSAKFDASGGTASILNVVMKKNRKAGYNGSIRAGADSRGRFNGGGDFNIRQQKVNLFLSGQYGQRKSKAWSDVSTNYNSKGTRVGVPFSLNQHSYNVNSGGFGFLRGGFDYFMDNRNTLTLSGNYSKGNFDNVSESTLRYDTFYTVPSRGTGTRNSDGDGSFTNYGGSVSYKHNYAKTGHELTADVNLNGNRSTNYTYIDNRLFTGAGALKQNPNIQQTIGSSRSTYWVIQTDYANPITPNAKIEAGLRAQIRNFTSNNRNDTLNSQGQFITNPFINSSYKYTDQVYAAYITFTGKTGNLGYNAGLRAESSNYDGKQLGLTNKDSAFNVSYPVSLFPSAFLSYKLSDKQDLQFNYTRRINRPNFFQLIPFTDYSDPQNLTRGNASLTPEFTNSLEANYNLQINNGNSFLASVYFRNTNNLITRYFDTAFNPNINQTVNRSTYVNANKSTSYGLELTSRNNITRTWDATTNLNFYNATLNGSNIGTSGTTNSRFSYFAKLNSNYRFGKNTSWTFQLNADYQGKTVLPVSSGGGGGGRGGGGGGFYGGSQGAAGTNGYVNPFYGVDLALKKEFMKNKAMSLTLSVQDVLKTRKRDTYTITDYYTQTYVTRRDQQIFRLQFNWRFGRQDINLFKRKNNRMENDNMSEGMQGGGGGH